METNNPKISVIIPVYNTEKYLRACLDSVTRQTFKDFEAIIIDNNSPDNSAEIIIEYVNKYPNFRTYKKIGGKAGGARNLGLEHAKGEFIYFLDSDDILENNALTVLYNTAQKYNADIVNATAYLIDSNGNRYKTNYDKEVLLSDTKDGIISILRHLGNRAGPHNRLIKRKIFTEHNLNFPENVPSEDVALITSCALFTKVLCQLNIPLYNYRYLPSSLSNSTGNLAPKSLFNNFALLRPKLQKYSFFKDDIREEWEYRLIHMIIGGEGTGNGSLKNLPLERVKEFFELSRDFYLNLPKDFFASRNIVFRLKYALFLFALKHNFYNMPKITRIFNNLFYTFYRIFCGDKNVHK